MGQTCFHDAKKSNTGHNDGQGVGKMGYNCAMKTALISDIHGNLTAFEAVLADIAHCRVSQIICLGDVIASGPQPRQCLERLQSLHCPVVMGNTDEWMLNPVSKHIQHEHAEKILAIDEWCAAQLSEEDKAYIGTFRPFLEHPLSSSQTLLCYHGSPRSNTEVIRADTPESELQPMFADHWGSVMAGGHTHTVLLRRYKDAFLLNPGSVGLPYFVNRQTGGIQNPAWAEYAMIESQKGELEITFHRVEYDIRSLVTAVRASQMPYADWWLEDW